MSTFPVAPLGCNCSIIKCKKTGEIIVIDPGGDGEKIISQIKRFGSHVKWIIHTHAHFDHCMATADIARFCTESNNFNQNIALHPDDLFLYENMKNQGNFFGVSSTAPSAPINYELKDNENICAGQIKLQILHTPGHSPGSCSFFFAEEELVFSGDTLFAMGVGRTDLPGGDMDTLIKSIKNRLFSLNDDTKVIPGHGEFTRISDEKRQNPFL